MDITGTVKADTFRRYLAAKKAGSVQLQTELLGDLIVQVQVHAVEVDGFEITRDEAIEYIHSL